MKTGAEVSAPQGSVPLQQLASPPRSVGEPPAAPVPPREPERMLESTPSSFKQVQAALAAGDFKSAAVTEFFEGPSASTNIKAHLELAISYFDRSLQAEFGPGNYYDRLIPRIGQENFEALYLAPLQANPAAEVRNDQMKAFLRDPERQEYLLKTYPELAERFYRGDSKEPLYDFWHPESDLGAQKFLRAAYAQEVLGLPPGGDLLDHRIPTFDLKPGSVYFANDTVIIGSPYDGVRVLLSALKSGETLSNIGRDSPGVALTTSVGTTVESSRGVISRTLRDGCDTIRVLDRSPYRRDTNGEAVEQQFEITLAATPQGSIKMEFAGEPGAVDRIAVSDTATPVQVSSSRTETSAQLRSGGSITFESPGRDSVDTLVTVRNAAVVQPFGAEIPRQVCTVDSPTVDSPTRILVTGKELTDRIFLPEIQEVVTRPQQDQNRVYRIEGRDLEYKSTRVDQVRATVGYTPAELVVSQQTAGVFVNAPETGALAVALYRDMAAVEGAQPTMNCSARDGLRCVISPETLVLIREPLRQTPGVEVGRIERSGKTLSLSCAADGMVDPLGAAPVRPEQSAAISSIARDGLTIAAIDGVGLRAAYSNEIAAEAPVLQNYVVETIENAMPKSLVIDSKASTYEMRGLGIFGGNIDFQLNPESFHVRVQGVSSPLISEAFNQGVSLVPMFTKTREVLNDHNDPRIEQTETVAALRSIGWDERGIEALRGGLGQTMSKLEVPSIVLSYLRDRKIDFSAVKIEDLQIDVFPGATAGEQQRFTAKIILSNLKVDGALPLGGVGRVAAEVVGIGSGLADAAEAVDDEVKDIPVVNVLSKVVLAVPWLVGQVGKAGKSGTNLAVGETSAGISLEVNGYCSPDGRWTIERQPLALALE
ncbi:MAG: hypothetical protein EBZ48_05500 [Proteobacteria bacterium]|nr:hypothetical protein [Pseudomonadota bacterium]